MERDELECFLILADELHFTRTADRMRLSKARVSQLVQRLERRVGAPLFVRTSRRVELTSLGRRLRDDLTPLHRGIEEAMARARAAANGVEGVLLVGFATSLAGEVVMRVSEAMRAEHRGLSTEVCEVSLADPYAQLRRGEFDVQLADFPVQQPDLAHGPSLFTEEQVVALPSGHPLAARDSVSVADLAGVPLLDVWAARHLPPEAPRGPVATTLQEALIMVAAGQGALPTGARTALYHGRPGVTWVPVRDVPPVAYGLIWRPGDGVGAVGQFARRAAGIAGELRTAEAGAV
ncbi:LysR family transcriptional regulator [Streptomyces avicenniae]|uniref:LysR family transcriptional regulator n=1 Tax=Streptomyces avicenniae TaxID=500153 RepID=UPI00069A4260|nr:LysR family transcriptional regulator [Streptomyces avicenniae]